MQFSIMAMRRLSTTPLGFLLLFVMVVLFFLSDRLLANACPGLEEKKRQGIIWVILFILLLVFLIATDDRISL